MSRVKVTCCCSSAEFLDGKDSTRAVMQTESATKTIPPQHQPSRFMERSEGSIQRPAPSPPQLAFPYPRLPRQKKVRAWWARAAIVRTPYTNRQFARDKEAVHSPKTPRTPV